MFEYHRIPARNLFSGCASIRNIALGRAWQTTSISFTHNITRQFGTYALSST